MMVVQEIFGVHEHIKDVCRRLAKAGYMSVAPELYARQGDVSKMEDIQQIIREVVSKVPDSQVMSDLDSTAAWIPKNSGNTSKLAITGFCWGGRIVWMYAAHNPNLKAGVAWYGRLYAADLIAPTNPIDVTGKLKAPVLGLYAGKDQGIPDDSVEKMRTALKDAGSKSCICIPTRDTASTPITGPVPRGGCERRLAAHVDLVQEERRPVIITPRVRLQFQRDCIRALIPSH